jgi:ubiquinol-cytochrome c reductase iron-sulfur subunit
MKAPQVFPGTLAVPGKASERRALLLATGAVGGIAAVAAALPLVASFAPSERARAQGAALEVDISDIAPGAMKTVEWRGKPVWVMRRTPEMAAGTANTSVGADWTGGFYCPCHGSTFDGAGRVFKNKPAPTNLEIPPHRYLSDTRILIGDDAAT